MRVQHNCLSSILDQQFHACSPETQQSNSGRHCAVDLSSSRDRHGLFERFLTETEHSSGQRSHSWDDVAKNKPDCGTLGVGNQVTPPFLLETGLLLELECTFLAKSKCSEQPKSQFLEKFADLGATEITKVEKRECWTKQKSQ